MKIKRKRRRRNAVSFLAFMPTMPTMSVIPVMLIMWIILVMTACGFGKGNGGNRDGNGQDRPGGQQAEGQQYGGQKAEGQQYGEQQDGESGSTPEDDRTPLVIGVFDDGRDLADAISLFQQRNGAYRIEIKKYERSYLGEEDGLSRLQREIMTGEGPDIIDFGAGYATSDIVGGYTEDLLPWLEGENEKIEEKYFGNILKAFCYRDKLYALPVRFRLQTFAGSSREVGYRTHWNIEEMISCYEERKGDMILYPGQTKRDVFGTILTGSMDYFIDWEEGSCRFDGEEFCRILEFANSFPEGLEITEDDSVKQIFQEGGALLLPLRLSGIYDICRPGFIFGEEKISYIGFPMEGKCGTVIDAAGPVLAISINSRNKEAAWEFISLFLEEGYQREQTSGFPLCRSVLEERLAQAREIVYEKDSEGRQTPVARDSVVFEGEDPVPIYCVTEEQAQTLTALIEEASMCTANDRQLYSLLLEEAQGYFSGEKSLEDTVRVMQSVASIYVGERVKRE